MKEKLEALDEFRQNLHDRTESTLSHALVLGLFYAGAAVVALGVLIVMGAWLLVKSE